MYNETLADRVRRVLLADDDTNGILEEKKMFGGLAFLLRGHMCCGLVGDKLMIRIDKTQTAKLLAEPHVQPMDFTGRPMKGFLYVEPPAIESAAGLRKWVKRSAAFVLSLPAKPAAKRRTAARRG